MTEAKLPCYEVLKLYSHCAVIDAVVKYLHLKVSPLERYLSPTCIEFRCDLL
jgi:hypothetical protein